ncbi:jerky protein homolog [Suricata suricatta]|uniref:jerky protein homolog n=1 Tax=Suricata suricatta TaxID=37032 RepID=UPI0011555314|nr:jerky protein homolog [Suricata suricatta]
MASTQAAGRSPGEKRKRVVLTLKEKMDICARLEKGESRKVLMQEYNVGMSTLYDIKAHKAQLLRFFASSDCNQALERRRTLHTPKLEHLDRVLYEWFLARRAEGVPVSGPMLIEKARDLYEQMQLTEPCVFSGGWLWRFKARHGIKKLDASGEKQAADHRAAEQFCGFFRSLAAEHGLSPEQVYNADETGLLWRCLPHPGLEGAQRSKDRLTVLMCANAAGSHKIKPLVIGKGGGPGALRGIQHLPGAYKAQGSAWVDKEIFADWFHHIFVPSVREHFRAVGLPEDGKAVLLLDGARARPREAQLLSDNVLTVFLPAGAAASVQPMDQGIRRDFLRNFVRPPAALQAAGEAAARGPQGRGQARGPPGALPAALLLRGGRGLTAGALQGRAELAQEAGRLGWGLSDLGRPFPRVLVHRGLTVFSVLAREPTGAPSRTGLPPVPAGTTECGGRTPRWPDRVPPPPVQAGPAPRAARRRRVWCPLGLSPGTPRFLPACCRSSGRSEASPGLCPHDRHCNELPRFLVTLEPPCRALHASVARVGPIWPWEDAVAPVSAGRLQPCLSSVVLPSSRVLSPLHPCIHGPATKRAQRFPSSACCASGATGSAFAVQAASRCVCVFLDTGDSRACFRGACEGRGLSAGCGKSLVAKFVGHVSVLLSSHGCLRRGGAGGQRREAGASAAGGGEKPAHRLLDQR